MSFTRVGYGQVEPNQLSAQKTGQIYASLPLDTDVDVLQNGEFMYYDQVAGKVSADDSTGLAEPFLVFNEIKLYEPFWRTSYKDFAMIRVGDNYVTSKLVEYGIVLCCICAILSVFEVAITKNLTINDDIKAVDLQDVNQLLVENYINCLDYINFQ